MLLVILLSAASTVAAPAEPTPPQCEKPQVTLVRSADQPLIRPLDKAPPAKQIYAVMRTDADGCVRPVAVRSTPRKR